MNFCHLHVHTEHSLLDGYGNAKQYTSKAKELGQDFCAITNHGNIDGLIRFQKEADKQRIKPVLGSELYVVSDMLIKHPHEKRYHVVVLIKNNTGFFNLSKMLTSANLEGFYYKPRVSFEDLIKNGNGLIFLTGCTKSFLTHEDGYNVLSQLNDKFPGDVYLEVMPHNFQEQCLLNKKCEVLSDKFGIPLVATNDTHYINEDESFVHEVLLAIQTKAKWSDPNRFKFEVNGLFLRSEQQMKDAFAIQDSLRKSSYLLAMRNTMEIAEKCGDFRIQKQDIFLPKVLENGADEDLFLKELCKKGYWDLFVGKIEDNQKYYVRFQEEFELIKKKGFVRYFLIVHEIAEWCRTNDVLLGPGRGSVSGRLIAFLIGVTSVDPLVHNLLFSRFIDEERIDFPDIDLDFQDNKRPLIRGHLEQLYGKNNIASVSTFMDMKGRSAIRDVGRVFDVPYSDIDEFAKTIHDDEEKDNSVEVASHTPEGQKFNKKFPDILNLAIKLEGQCRSVGQHAAALIVSADDLTQGTRGNLSVRSGHEVINWGKDDAEYIGLMKLDILGLNTLTVLAETKRLIKQNHNKEIILEAIKLDNPQVFEMLSRGETVGVFQIGTGASTRLAKEVGIDNFATMGDVVALVRPGPADSGQTEEYKRRKHGGTWKKKNRIYEKITKDTFGIIVYQEQVMQVINQVAGLPYSVADKIRKIISKKRDVKQFEQYKQMFVDGCKKEETLSGKEANEFWDMLEKHAGYSFNKAHSTAYSIISYWCAFCKLYYPAEFICANLTYGSDGKKEELVKEARRIGLKIILPKAGISDSHKWAVKDKNIYVPFIEIKGVGEKTAIECSKYRDINGSSVGFFNSSVVSEKDNKISKLLKAVGAIGNTPEEDLTKYFSFDIKEDKRDEFPNLKQVLNKTLRPTDLESHLSLSLPPKYLNGIITQARFQSPELIHCQKCDLFKQCRKPVLPSQGRYNIAIVGEAPGKREDDEGSGFVGKSGELLWGELEKYDLTRRFFHVTNVCKCFPSETKTPTAKHLDICRVWLDEELKKINVKLMLVFGNTGLLYFKNEIGGISKYSGKTEWSERYLSWICYGMHPAAALYNSDNKKSFQEGIKNFVDKINVLGGL
jgi:DNA polymerase-3 subunit alpha